MSEKLGVVNVNVNSGNSGATLGESSEGVTGRMVEGLESKIQVEDHGDKGVLSDEVRVLESKDLVVESDGGTVTSGNGQELVKSGRLEINDHIDARRRVIEGWELMGGVMDLVGRVLKGKFSMDAEEEEDVKNSEKLHEENKNRFANKNLWQGLIGETTSENGIDVKETAIDKDSDKLISGSPRGGSGLTESRDLVRLNSGCPRGGTGIRRQDFTSNEMAPDGKFENEEVINVNADVSTVKGRVEHYITEKEGEYYVSDLVWGKVKSHPWWPGQIFAPSAASDKAARYFKKDSYLIAYFGDQTFAWNDGSKIRAFRMHFSEMEKQSNADGFCHAVRCAVDEVARRVQLGLSCPCLPQEVRNEIKFQVVANAGIREESSIISGGNNLSSAASFYPGELVQFLESLAECPKSKTDQLQFATAKAQLVAVNRWKGRYQLPIFQECIGILEDDIQFTETEGSLEEIEGLRPGPVSEAASDFPSKKRKSTARDGSFQKRKLIPGDGECLKIKEKRLSVLMSSGSSNSQNDEEKLVRKTGRKAISSDKIHGNFISIPNNLEGKIAKNLSSTSPSGDMASQPTTYLRDRERICLALESGEKSYSIGRSLASTSAGNSQKAETVPAEIPTPDVILSKLIMAAKSPMQVHSDMIPAVGFLRELRHLTCLEKSSSENAKLYAIKLKGKQPLNLETTDAFGFEGSVDSYWTDRIIQNYSQDPVFFEPEKPIRVEGNTGVVLNVADNKERDVIIVGLDTENNPVPMNEVSVEDRPTALILNFTNLESIPSITNLNEIFSRYGPVNETETRILSKSKRAKVIFKRKADAETAFSSTGKYSIFGPSLVSYRLHYEPIRKSSGTSKKNKKTHP